MRPKEGTKIELQRFFRFVRLSQICSFRFFRIVRFADFRDLKKMRDEPTDLRTDRPSYRDAWTHLKTEKKKSNGALGTADQTTLERLFQIKQKILGT